MVRRSAMTTEDDDAAGALGCRGLPVPPMACLLRHPPAAWPPKRCSSLLPLHLCRPGTPLARFPCHAPATFFPPPHHPPPAPRLMFLPSSCAIPSAPFFSYSSYTRNATSFELLSILFLSPPPPSLSLPPPTTTPATCTLLSGLSGGSHQGVLSVGRCGREAGRKQWRG